MADTDRSPLVPEILVVDDNEADRYILRRLIRKGNVAAEVFEETNGHGALEFLNERARRDPDTGVLAPLLVLVDANMPVMGGFEFLDSLAEERTGGAYDRVTVVMASSSAHPEDRARALAHDFVQGYLVKMPKTPEELRATLAEHVANGTAR